MFSSFVLSAQESVVLRVNHNKGDKYLIEIEQINSMGLAGGMNLKMTMDMLFTDIQKDSIVSESKITSVVMDMMQGGMIMSYDSTKKEEELDQMGKILKAQIEPMMQSIIINTVSPMGKTLSTKIVPSFPGMEQFANNSNNIPFPVEKVSVGSTWSEEDENQGIKSITTYKVSKISEGTVYVDISGDVSGVGVGKINGKSEIDIKTGLQKLSEIDVSINSQGQDVKTTAKIKMTKV